MISALAWLLDWDREGRDPGRPDEARRGCGQASIMLGVAIGVQWLLAAAFAFGPARAPARADLTDWGRAMYQPERDLPIYVAGCVASLALARALLAAWRRRADRVPPPGPTDEVLAGWAAWQLLLALGSSFAFLALAWRGGRASAAGDGPWRLLGFAVLIMPGGLALLTAAFRFASPRPSSPWPPAAWAWAVHLLGGAQAEGDADGGPAPRRWAGAAVDLASATLIVAVVFCPDWGWLVSRSPEVSERLIPYYHWNAFAMSPAVGFRDGGALGVDVFSQYGVAWPLLFTALDPILPLSYATMMKVSVVYGCLYYIGIYALLRLATGRATWALAGALASIGIQLFRGIEADATIWTFPSSTFLRSPLDAWFFLALLMHSRTSRGGWIALASSLAGLSVAFEIDTGIYLSVSLALYATLARSGRPGDAAGPRRAAWPLVLACGCSFLAPLLACLALAARGDLLRPGFWGGWIEGAVKYGGGMFALPLATAPGIKQVGSFYASACLLLVLFGRALGGSRGPRARAREVFWATLAAYGLADLILFVYRSHPYNIDHVCVPIVAAATYAAASAADLAGRASPPRPGKSRRPALPALAGAAALALGLMLLLRAPAFRAYPSLLSMAIPVGHAVDRPADHARSGRKPAFGDLPAEYEPVVAEMAALRSGGEAVGVVGLSEAMLYLQSGCPVPFRDSPLIIYSLTLDQLRENLEKFRRKGLTCVFLEDGDRYEKSPYVDAWRAFRAVIGEDYAFRKDVGPFGLWVKRGRVCPSASTPARDAEIRGAGRLPMPKSRPI